MSVELEDPVTNEFKEVVINHDLSDPDNLPQEPKKAHPSVANLKQVREHFKDTLGLHARTPEDVRAARRKFMNPMAASLTLPPIERCKTDLDGGRRRTKSPTPNYTMINKRVPNRERAQTGFKGLNSTFKPIPNLLDKPHEEKQFVNKSMDIWEKEVKKLEKAKTKNILETIAAWDLKIARCRQLMESMKMRDLYEYRKIREVMEEYVPKLKMGSIRQKPKPFKERVDIPKSPSQKDLADKMANDMHRQAAAKHLTVSLDSLEIYRNDITSKVKMLDVKLSFSYQEDFTTQTVRLDKHLVRNGKKWTWLNEDGSKKVITFPYLPGDRVNLNMGIFVHKTKKHGLFGKETITTQAGTVAECIVLARNNGVGMGLPLGQSITQDLRLNFDLNGRGHKLTVKLKLDLKSEKKGPPIMWLRPMSSDRRFRSFKTAYELLLELPPREKDEDARVKLFVYNNQRLVNYQKAPVIDCRSVRPADVESEIPTGIELRQSLGSELLAYLVPVVKTIDKQSVRYRLAILVVTTEGPYCLCSAKWKSADKFDYKIHIFKTGETFGQRIKWASKDFLDISYAILNSTGHQMTLKTESKTPIEDICIALSLKFLVRWSNEPLPWRLANIQDMDDMHKVLTSRYSSVSSRISDSMQKDIKSHMRELPLFMEQHDLMVFSDVEECLCGEQTEENRKPSLIRKTSDSSCDDLQIKPRHEMNYDEVDDEDDIDGDATTVSSKPKFDINWDDFPSSGFVDGKSRSEFTGAGSMNDIESEL